MSEMAKEMAKSIATRANELVRELQDLERARAELQQESGILAERCRAQQREIEANQVTIEAQEQRLAELRRLLPESPADQEVLTLDVGGQSFKARRSTLAQFEGSMLATLVSRLWADTAKAEDGRIFLDMDPTAFGEVLAFLRDRQMSRCVRAELSSRATRLAEYMGVPVESAAGEAHIIRLELTAEKDELFCDEMMFDLSMGSGCGCFLRAITVTPSSDYVGELASLTVYTRVGSCRGPPWTDRSQWSEICEVEVERPSTRIVLPRDRNLYIAPNATVALLLSCSHAVGCLPVSQSQPRFRHVDLSTVTRPLNDSELLVVQEGREESPYGWAPDSGYFLGEIEYELA